MSKTLILDETGFIKGQLEIEVILSSSFSKKYIGRAQLKKYSSKRKIFKNAIYDAIYKHVKEGGNSSPRILILDYKVKYISKLISVKRVNIKNNYRSIVRSKKTGRILKNVKWEYVRNPNKYI